MCIVLGVPTSTPTQPPHRCFCTCPHRHTYPACAACSDLTATEPSYRSVELEFRAGAYPVHDLNDDTRQERRFAGLGRGAKLGAQSCDEKANELCIGFTADEVIDITGGDLAVSCAGVTAQAPLQVGSSLSATECRDAAYTWYETNKLSQRDNRPMFYYLHAKSCYVIRSDLMGACIPADHSQEVGGSFAVMSAQHSQAPWYTCFAYDKCREECRAALGDGLDEAQTNAMVHAWMRALDDEASGRTWTGLNTDTVLFNSVRPDPGAYSQATSFPRATHFLYGYLSSATLPWTSSTLAARWASDWGRKNQGGGTYYTMAVVNQTLKEARVAAGFTFGDTPTSLQSDNADSAAECPDNAWCAPSTAKLPAGRTRFDVRKFCALPAICPVRTHHPSYKIDAGGAPASAIPSTAPLLVAAALAAVHTLR